MDTRVAVVSIIVSDESAAPELNGLLHRYGRFIIGRLGLPYHAKNVNIICVAMDAPADEINALAGALGRIAGLSAKVTYSQV